MKKIKLSRGKIALVDDEDFEKLRSVKWSCIEPKPGKFYAVRRTPGADGIWRAVSMHREIMGNPRGFWVDHINGDGLDNRRRNLRLAKPNENNRNRRLSKKNKSGFKGVSWVPRVGKWRATIDVGSKTFYLGTFKKIKDAARIYDEAARERFGEFACTNENLGLLGREK